MKAQGNKIDSLDEKLLLTDKRGGERRGIVKITSKILIDEKLFPVYVMDISESGARLKSSNPFPSGTSIKLVLSKKDVISGEIKWIRGEIKWIKELSENEYCLGVEFEKFLIIEDIDDFKYSEKRKFERKMPEQSIYIGVCSAKEDDNLKEMVRVLDISKGGIRILSPHAIELGTLLKLELSKSNIVTGEVRWCSSVFEDSETNFFIGIEFVEDNIDKKIEEFKNRS